MKNKKIFYLLLLIITISGCSEKKKSDLYYLVVTRGFPIPDSSPLILSFHNGKKDTITCCVSGYNLYENWNLKAMNDLQFREMLYETIISKSILEVNEELFNYYKKWCLIESEPEIKTLYEREGIKGVLDKYLDEYNGLMYLSEIRDFNYDYIIYLAFINNLYFYWDDFTGGLYLYPPD